MANMLDVALSALNPIRGVINAYDWLDETVGPASYSKNLPEPGLVDVSGMMGGPMPIVNAARRLAVPSQLTKAQELMQWSKGADKSLLGKNNVPEVLYHGSERAKNNLHDVAEGMVPKHAYQKEGYAFTSPNPGFAAEYSGKTYMGAPMGATAEDIAFINKLSSLEQGEGNMMQLMHRNKNVFDPGNQKHYDEYLREFNKDPNVRDLRNPDIGWKQSEKPQMLQFLKDKGYDGQWINEVGNKNFMTNTPGDTRNIFDAVDLTNPMYRRGVNPIGVGIPGMLNIGTQYDKL